jgi:hypothetical protein
VDDVTCWHTLSPALLPGSKLLSLLLLVLLSTAAVAVLMPQG